MQGRQAVGSTKGGGAGSNGTGGNGTGASEDLLGEHHHMLCSELQAMTVAQVHSRAKGLTVSYLRQVEAPPVAKFCIAWHAEPSAEIIREQQNVPDTVPAFLGDGQSNGNGDKVSEEGAPAAQLRDDDDSADSREVSVAQ